MQPQAQFGQFADAYRLVADVFEAFLPPARKSVAQWAAEKRWMNNPGGGYTGLWNNEHAPYLVKPMEVLLGTSYLNAIVIGPAQSGKTTIGENWFGASVDLDPADFLWYMQTDQVIQGYVKDRINTMIADHDCLRSRLGLNAVDDSLHYKRFVGMRLEFLAGAYANMISKKAPRIIVDEIDAYQAALGDVMALLNPRRQTFGRESMMLAMSHPDRATGIDPDEDWSEGIMAAYRDSDRRVWYWPCPECGGVSSPAPIAKWVMRLDYPTDPDVPLDVVAEKTVLVCPHNGCIIADHQRRDMNIAALNSPYEGWIGTGQEIGKYGEVEGQLIETDSAGFWILGVMSPFLLSGIGGLARALVKAEREVEAGDSDTAVQSLRAAYSKGLGIPPLPLKKVGSVDAATLVERAEDGFALGTVPAGVRFLTCFIDVQRGYFDVMVRGWGMNGESWVVAQFKVTVSERTGPAGDKLPIDPAHEAADWDQVLRRMTEMRFPLADDLSRGMAIRAIGYDSAGEPGVTPMAYDAWKRWRKGAGDRPPAIKAYGQIGGRDVYSIMPMKGIAGVRATRLAVVYPDSQRKDRQVKTRGEIPLVQFSPNAFKDELAGHLGKAEPGEWYVHVPAALKSKQAPHAFFEQMVAEARNKAGQWEKIKPSAKNEALDQMVGTHVLAHLHGLTRINWERPHAWAAPHEVNTMVGPIDAPTPTSSVPRLLQGGQSSTVKSLGSMLP
jgi:phage terminase large subunit GpA-like protein